MPPPTALPVPAPSDPCPCGSGQPFAACCAPVLSGARTPATAEELMRARFTAHVARDFAFLDRTFIETASRKGASDDADAPKVPWTRLVVHHHEVGPQPDVAYVEFSAHFLDQGMERSLDEKAEFHRHDGKWIYTRPVRQGPAPVKVAAKPGRNDPCPCGSGKKYKHCCMP